MALQLDMNIHGAPIPAMYAKVVNVSGNKNRVVADLFYYASAAVSNANGSAIYTEQHTFVPSVVDGSDNFIKQAYGAIKVLPAFSGASDV